MRQARITRHQGGVANKGACADLCLPHHHEAVVKARRADHRQVGDEALLAQRQQIRINVRNRGHLGPRSDMGTREAQKERCKVQRANKAN